MRKIIFPIIALVLVLMYAAPPQASAQDFDRLLDAVERLEANLKALVQSETAERQAAISQLRTEMKQMKQPTPGAGNQAGPEVAQMQKDIAWLKETMAQLMQKQAEQPGADLGVQGVDMVTLMAELDYLRAEVQRLAGLTSQHTGQLASLEDIGYPQQGGNPDQVQQLTDRLTAINTALEGFLAQPRENAPEVKRGKIRLGGYVHQYFSRQEGSDATSTFSNKRSRVLLLGPINEYAQILIQTDFAGSPKLLDAHFTLTPVKGLSFTVGQMIAPFSTDYMTSPAALPLVSNAMTVGLAPGRDLGAMLSYQFGMGGSTNMKLSAGVFNGAGINTTDANKDKNVIARAELSFMNMFTLAPNLNIGHDNGVDSVKQEINSYGGSLMWQWGNEVVGAEYLYKELGDVARSAWYIWGGHSFATGWNLFPVIQPVMRYEQYDPQTGIAENRTDRITLGTNFYVDKNYTKVQINYLINTEEGESVDNNEFLMNFQVAF